MLALLYVQSVLKAGDCVKAFLIPTVSLCLAAALTGYRRTCCRGDTIECTRCKMYEGLSIRPVCLCWADVSLNPYFLDAFALQRTRQDDFLS